MRNRILIFTLTVFITNFCFAQEKKYYATNSKEILYSYDKKDSSFIFKRPYIMDESSFDGSLNIQIEIDSVTIINLNEIPYNIKNKEFLVVIPNAYIIPN